MDYILRQLRLSSNTTVKTTAATCCQDIAQIFGPNVADYKSESYEAIRNSYWSSQEAAISPGCFLVPKDTNDVSRMLSLISGKANCPFAIKGSTHAPFEGFANIQNGITIDTTKLNSLNLNEDRTVLSIGAGSNWLSVYSLLDKFDLGVAGGRAGVVGVGGLSIGGGISHHSGEYGLSSDNIINFEAVLSSGTVVNANETANSDLYWALKGGGNNFALVTRVDYTTFPQKEFSITEMSHDISYSSAIAKEFNAITDAPTFDPYVSLLTIYSFSAADKVWKISNSAIYTKPDLNPPVYEKLLSIPSIQKKRFLQRPSSYANASYGSNLNWHFWTGTYQSSAQMIELIIEIANYSLQTLDLDGKSSFNVAFEPLPTAITKQTCRNGGDPMGICEQKVNAFVLHWFPFWSDSSANDKVVSLSREIRLKVREVAQEMGQLVQYEHLNFADPDQNPFKSYGADNVDRLQAISQKYDPGGVFQKQVPGGYKLPTL